jgi:hypothetical protein
MRDNAFGAPTAHENAGDGPADISQAHSRPDLALAHSVWLFARELRKSGAITDVMSNLAAAIDHPDFYLPRVEIAVRPDADTIIVLVMREPGETSGEYTAQVAGTYPQRFWFDERTLDEVASALRTQLTYHIARLGAASA